MNAKPSMSILFVCLGNICRSPLAEGVLRTVLAERGQIRPAVVASAGTGGWHSGEPPDRRSISVAARHGIDISGQRARQVESRDFHAFAAILGMDRSNVRDLKALAPAGTQGRIHLYLDYALGKARDVPDPYYGGPREFDEVYGMIREASEALAARLAVRASGPASGQASSTT